MFVGDDFEDLEAEKWVNGKPDFSSGTYILHQWDPKCLRCHTELEMLAEIARYRGISLVIIHTPEHEFEDRDFLEKTVEDKQKKIHAAYKPERQRWMSDSSPKKLVIEDGEVKHHSTDDHNLKNLKEFLGIQNSLEIPHKSEEKHMGLINSSLYPEHRFHGVKELDSNRPAKDGIKLDGEWKQTEEYIEAKSDASIHFITDKDNLYMVLDPQESIKTVEVVSNQVKVASNNIKFSGLKEIADLGVEGDKEVEIRPEEGLRIYKMELV